MKAVLSLGIVVLAFALSVFAYPHVQTISGQVPTHWNLQGEVNGYGSPFVGVFLVPIIAFVLWLLFRALPHLEVYRKNLQRSPVYSFEITILLFFLITHCAILLRLIGAQFNMSLVIIPLVGALFIVLGMLLRKVKRNFFIGIRTPWTLSSDKIWDKTHVFGSKLFIISGVILMLSVFVMSAVVWILLVCVFASAFASVIYSYVLFKRTKKR